MNGWTNKKPETDGYYWLFKKIYLMNDKEQENGPDIVGITIDENGFVEALHIGSDVPDDIRCDDENIMEGGFINALDELVRVKCWVKPIKPEVFPASNL